MDSMPLLDPEALRELELHPTEFYKYAIKDEYGWPRAEAMFWNTEPRQLCPEIHQNSVFDAEFDDVVSYDIRQIKRNPDGDKHCFNLPYCPGDPPSRSSVQAVKSSPDYDAIKSWMEHCGTHHKLCHAEGPAAELEIITLIDVQTKTLVPYKKGMKYAALSYVWGQQQQDADLLASGKHHEVPATIRHAMTVAAKVDIPFLWVDALCIDQKSEKAKSKQLPIMDHIYERSYATIIALGDHANSGLPGVDDGPQRTPQLTAEFGPVRLLSRCPTLTAEIQSSRWPTRSWTFQEGIFPRRRIFFSAHQVYFQCNEMFCTEDSRAMIEFARDKMHTENYRDFGYHASDINHPKSHPMLQRNLERLVQHPSEKWNVLPNLLFQYVCRQPSRNSDTLPAFIALLERLKRNAFSQGFAYGIPKDDFCTGLFWKPAPGVSLMPRPDCGFPSWSWAAWKFIGGGLNFLPDSYGCVNVPAPLWMWLDGNEMETPHRKENTQLTGIGSDLERLWITYRIEFQTGAIADESSIAIYSDANGIRPQTLETQPLKSIGDEPFVGRSLFVEGPVLTLPYKYNRADQAVHFDPSCYLPKSTHHSQWTDSADVEGISIEGSFLVLKSSWVTSFMTYVEFHLMLLDWQNEEQHISTRGGCLYLRVEENLQEFWSFANAKHKCFWLV